MDYIKSVHRPYNSRLKSVRWVCEFSKTVESDLKQDFVVQFYLYIIERLHKIYHVHKHFDSYGLPSIDAINEARDYLNGISQHEKTGRIKSALISNNKAKIEKILFSTYKAASFFVTLTKQLGLISQNNQLTEKGQGLLDLKSFNNFSLTANEKVFFLKLIAQKDLVQFVLQVHLNKIESDYKLAPDAIEMFCIQFLSQYYPVLGSIGFKTKSIRNYMDVRSKWIEDLNVLKKNRTLKSTAIAAICSALSDASRYNDLVMNITKFQKSQVQPYLSYQKLKRNFIDDYKVIRNSMQIQGFDYVNLYDIMKKQGISYNKLQRFLDEFVMDKEYRFKVHFQNTVRSIDGRPRFLIRSVLVISIRIDGV